MAESQHISVTDRDYLLLKLDENPGSFLTHFLKACLAADSQNWAIMYPVLVQVRQKYPLKKQQLNEQTHGQ
jgi:hypothetical protein